MPKKSGREQQQSMSKKDLQHLKEVAEAVRTLAKSLQVGDKMGNLGSKIKLSKNNGRREKILCDECKSKCR